MHKNCLIIFVKNPVLGKVKTRLAKTIGDEAALEIYQKLLKHTHHITENLPIQKTVFYSDKITEGLWADGFEKKMQMSGDLGQKMSAAFHEEIQQHQKVCVIGSDCAQLTTEIIKNAFSALDQHDAVIGPANDGGYYLIGLKASQPSIFEDVSWSTDQVLTQTIQKLEAAKLTYTLLPELIDVDTEEDWDKVKSDFS